MMKRFHLLFEEFSCKIYNLFKFSQAAARVAKAVMEIENILKK